ncbi:LolA family protein [Parvularcula dongshanensis]|uniref:Outer membrane lipoprotein-sorting protein n=1 Tax=Parvularcula dongshanensis TaxID=1173995 RepID=A0A840I150_9PROT|nr:outer-membrane lipoprotein carrier protein LolA [Parvularcula dongshanensis]MBB4658075.1 outer membrane lipoprotein-sorting protein [Parvularcula dongshanensis]
MIIPLLVLLASQAASPAPSEPELASAEAAPLDLPEAPLALGGLSDEEVYARAAAALEAVDTLQARFVQTAPSGSVSSGEVYLDRPGRLRFDYDEPSAQEVVATGGLVYVHDADLETTDSYPVSKTPLRFLLSKRIDTEGAQLLAVRRTPDEVSLTLEAADDELTGEVALVFAVDGDDLTLSRWAVFDPRGGVTVVSLEGVETGGKLSRNLFRIPEAGGAFVRDRR